MIFTGPRREHGARVRSNFPQHLGPNTVSAPGLRESPQKPEEQLVEMERPFISGKKAHGRQQCTAKRYLNEKTFERQRGEGASFSSSLQSCLIKHEKRETALIKQSREHQGFDYETNSLAKFVGRDILSVAKIRSERCGEWSVLHDADFCERRQTASLREDPRRRRRESPQSEA